MVDCKEAKLRLMRRALAKLKDQLGLESRERTPRQMIVDLHDVVTRREREFGYGRTRAELRNVRRELETILRRMEETDN